MTELELLKILKNGLLEVNPNIKDSKQYFGHTNQNWKNSEKAQNYYLFSMENNLYKNIKPKFNLGSGSNAVRSSAAMIYNTLYLGNLKGKDGVKFCGYEPMYEIPFPAIKDDEESTHTAKLDAGLISSDGNILLLFEAKCMEWFDKKPKSLKKAYLNCKRYLSKESASIFIPLFKEFVQYEEGSTEYKPKTIRYDSIQMLIHILGIYNKCLEKRIRGKQIRLINLVWDYECVEYHEEEKEGEQFVKFANQLLQKEFNLLGVGFCVEYVRYSDFLNRIDWTNDIEHWNYLARYDVKRLLREEFQ